MSNPEPTTTTVKVSYSRKAVDGTFISSNTEQEMSVEGMTHDDIVELRSRLRDALYDELKTDIDHRILTHNDEVGSQPQPDGPGYTSSHAGSGADAIQQVGQQASDGAAGWVSVKGKYGDIEFPTRSVFDKDQMENDARDLLRAEGFDDAYFVVYDNRFDLEKGKDRSGHVGAIKLLDGAPGKDKLGGLAAYWVDFNAATKSVEIHQTKKFGNLPPAVLGQLALAA